MAEHDDLTPLDWAFHFETGRPCLDFAATLAERMGRSYDRWQSTADLQRWLAEGGYAISARLTDRDLAAARTLREAIYRIVSAAAGGKKPKPADIALLNDWAAKPVAAPQLNSSGTESIVAAKDPFTANLALIARDAIDLVTGPDLARLRECAEHSCSVLFVDLSRPGKRRWCSMSRCGNRMKKAAFRARQADA
jgi:predicted RNA-binding Zn ribbon-like protein